MTNNIILIEDELVKNFYPITLTKPTATLQFGTTNILENLKIKLNSSSISIITRDYLIEIAKNKFPKISINERIMEDNAIIINSLINPNMNNLNKIIKKKEKFIILSGNDFVAGRISKKDYQEIIKKRGFSTKKLIKNAKNYNILNLNDDSLIRYPWQFLKESAKAIEDQFKILKRMNNTKKQFKYLSKNSNILISTKAIIPDLQKIYINSKNGPVIIDEQALIEPFSVISGPVYIGKRTKILGAKIYKDTVIANDCVIGGEIQSSIFHEYTNKAHLGYIGHSIIGSWVNLGALTTNSDLKNSYGNIKIKFGNRNISTNINKYGCMIGDNVKTSIGSLIFTGKNIGIASQLYGHINEDIPSFTIVNNFSHQKMIEADLNSIILTQARMMKRRGVVQQNHDKELLKKVFEMTKLERIKLEVKRGKIRI